jgi:transcriptional regulator with XRE-family HTH domain
VEIFGLVGETLRRLRKERRMTLAQLGRKAGLGRGQLSRIENGHQEATLSTLAKILASQGVTRREFFRRYDLVETEKVQVDLAAGTVAESYPAPAGATLPGEIRETLGRVESIVAGLFAQSQPLAQGAIELGDYVVLFRVVPRGAAGEAQQQVAPATPVEPPPPAGHRRSRAKKS